MEIEKAIKIFEKLYESDLNFLGSHHITIEEYKKLLAEKNEIVNLLKRGEKFEAMWGEIEKEIQICLTHNLTTKRILLNVIKQKYFPKEN